MTVMTEQDYLAHYGILRKSGRYPWGSGNTQSARNKKFLDVVNDLKSQGMSDTEIARGFSTKEHPFTTTDLRALRSIATNEQKQERISTAVRLRDKGMSNIAIGEQMGINESSVRSLLAADSKDKANSLAATTAMLRREVDAKGAVDIGRGVERDLPLGENPAARIGITTTKLNTAVAALKEEGYQVHTIKVPQAGTGKDTTRKVLAKPTDNPKQQWRELVTDPGKIELITNSSDDGGRTWTGGFQTPISISSKRVSVRYKEDGGDQADGVIYVRPGAKDLSLGSNKYAQVRIAVDGTHYLKGMAVQKDDLPPGVDLVFNTNKSNTGNKLDALKKQEDDPDRPFGAVVRQLKDDKGKVTSAMNIVNEEGNWDDWSRSLSSQMLSKQNPALAQKQLDITYANQRKEYEAISALTNPVVKKKLLESFSDGADSAAVHLKAAAMPRQVSRAILPVPSMKPTEVYAPHLQNGELVALVRYPHGGTFEIPQLTVNNKNREAQKMIGPASSGAIGIHHTVAERLSGADFDGDAVLVIPNGRGEIKSSPPLEGLKGFDPRSSYKSYPGMKTVDGGTVREDGSVDYQGRQPRRGNMQNEMGKVSNLITDMTIQGASNDELARAVRHSMVVIDSEKHVLDYKASARNNGIPALKEKYQGGSTSGATTIISRAGSKTRLPERRLRKASEGGSIDPKTGKKVYVETGEFYTNAKGEKVFKEQVHKRLAVTDDAHTLVSTPGTRVERIYADHSNRLKALANQARKDSLSVGALPTSASAKQVYSKEVDELNAALNLAKKNAPLERQAQSLTASVVAQKKAANPNWTAADEKKARNAALAEMRSRTGAGKQRIEITPSQWDAIQAGAISKSKLSEILDNADLDVVRKLATPKPRAKMDSNALSRARQMMANGYTQGEIATQLGVSVTTLKAGLSGE